MKKTKVFYVWRSRTNRDRKLEIIDGFSENTISLKQNLRNTNEINTFVNTLFNKNVDSSDINGDEVDQYVFSSQDIASQINELEVQLSKILNELKNEGYELSDIAILTTHAQRIKDIKSIKVFGKNFLNILRLKLQVH